MTQSDYAPELERLRRLRTRGQWLALAYLPLFGAIRWMVSWLGWDQSVPSLYLLAPLAAATVITSLQMAIALCPRCHRLFFDRAGKRIRSDERCVHCGLTLPGERRERTVRIVLLSVVSVASAGWLGLAAAFAYAALFRSGGVVAGIAAALGGGLAWYALGRQGAPHKPRQLLEVQVQRRHVLHVASNVSVRVS